MQAQEIIDEVSKQLNDTAFVTWTEASLREYITSAEQAIVNLRPDAFSTVTTMQMAVGAKQTIPTNALRLLDVKRNMGTDGNTPGRPVNAVEEEAVDLFELTEEAASVAIKDFSYDERVGDVFYVYPPSDGTGWLEIAISQIPPNITFNQQTLSVSDIYRNAVVQYVMFRAYSIEIDSVSSRQRASEHLANFYQLMGAKFQRDVQFSPSVEVQEGA